MFAIKDFIKDYIFISLAAFLVSVTLTPIIRRSCRQKNILDFPSDPRKIHAAPVPRLGGIAIYLGFFIPLFSVFLTSGKLYSLFAQHVDILLGLFIASTIVFAIGVYDDLRGATVVQKFLVQGIAAVLIYFLGFKIQLISIPFVGSVDPGILSLPLTILWLVGVTNAINFIDGIDGLACGVGFFSISTIFILSLFLHRTLTAFFAAALAGGLLGFGVYNFAPASIFMGDSGSLVIGFVIAAISLHGTQKSSTTVVLLIPIIALGVPIADTLLAIIRRLGNGRSPFMADSDHIHHRMLRLGLSSRQVTLVLYGICSTLGVLALLMTSVNNKVLTLILIILSVMVIGGMQMLGYTTDMVKINHLAKERILQRRKVLKQQKNIEEIVSEIQMSPDLATLQKALIRYFENMEFDVGGIRGNKDALAFSWKSPRYIEQHMSSERLWRLEVPLMLNMEEYGKLFIGKLPDSTTSLLEHTAGIETLTASIECSLHTIFSEPSSC